MITIRSVLPWVVGLGTGLGFLFLTISHLDAGSIQRVWNQVSLAWLVPAMIAYAAAISVRVLRWRELLQPMRALGFAEVGKPLLVGFALNYIFPARLGELFRAHYARDIFTLSRSAVFGTIVAERSFDLVAVVLLLVIGVLSAVSGDTDSQSLPLMLLKSASLVLVLLAIGAFGLWLIQRSGVMKNFPVLNRRAVDFGDGLHSIFRSNLPVLVATTLLVWGLELMAIWSMLAASGVRLGPSEVALVMGCVSLSTLIPNAPGFIGTFQFAFFVSLNLIGFDGAHGVMAASFTQAFLFLPITVVGIVLMTRSGISISK